MIKISNFIKIHSQLIYNYHLWFFNSIKSGNIQMNPTGFFYYANQANYFESPHFIIAELVGYSKIPTKIKPQIIKIDNIDSYFDLFNEGLGETLFNIQANNCAFINFGFGRSEDIELLEERFGIKHIYPETSIIRQGKGVLAHIDENVGNFFMNKCVLLSRKGNFFRFRDVQNAVIYNKKGSEHDLEMFLKTHLSKPFRTDRDLIGITFSKNRINDVVNVSKQFANLFLNKYIDEKTIDAFISNHKRYFEKIFNSSKILNQVQLKWVEGRYNGKEKYIKPDIFILREDGYYDICDLKLPLLDRDRLTTGEHRRRAFIHYINNGIAQLANYRDYFSFEKNKKYAEKNFGIKINNPKLILIVGNYENYNTEEIREASRPFDKDIIIIDYDSINRILVGKAKQ